MKNLKFVVIFAIISALLVFAILVWGSADKKKVANSVDDFAKCLASQNITMYGAAWCAHCQNQKNLFGDSFEYVPYVECPDNPQKCLEKGIAAYPTWIFPDGRKLIGEQGLKKLSQESGCSLPGK